MIIKALKASFAAGNVENIHKKQLNDAYEVHWGGSGNVGVVGNDGNIWAQSSCKDGAK